MLKTGHGQRSNMKYSMANHAVAFFVLCVAFGDSRALVLHTRIWQARASITLAHIWRPATAKRLSELTFAEVFVKATRAQSRELTATHVSRLGRLSERLSLRLLCFFGKQHKREARIQEHDHQSLRPRMCRVLGGSGWGSIRGKV